MTTRLDRIEVALTKPDVDLFVLPDMLLLIRVARAAASFANRIEAMPVEDYKNVVVECIAIERTLLPLLEEV